MVKHAAAGLCALALCSAGCYFSNPPSTPYGTSPPNLDGTPTLAVASQPIPLRSPKLILLGRVQTYATQPLGGVYDQVDYDTVPLTRTYFFKHAHLELFEHTCDVLRASGLDVRKDYATTGFPSLVEPHLLAQDPIIVRTWIVSFQHDQVRADTDPVSDNEVLKLVFDVQVIDARSTVLYQTRHSIQAHMPYQEEQDVLRILGLRMGEVLAKDKAFLKAVQARQAGAG